jgi:pectin methylesterase-like acyl-CoA thioesterase
MKQSINLNITMKTILICFLLLISSMGVLGATLSDQGTDVRYKSTGYLVSSGDLTISIWDSMTSGTNIFNYTYTSAIVNGSWNVMIGEAPSPDLSLDFNTLYYKDYSIDGEDIDFINGLGATVERQIFESPLGNVNYNNLTNVPSYITDGDDDILGALACSSNQIARYNGTAWECYDINSLNISMNPNDSAFSAWDKNASDDFNGSWYSLLDVPSGFADGIDNNTDDTGWKNYISTGLVDGGTLSINANTSEFDIANTSCYFLDLTDVNNPSQTKVDFSENNGIESQFRTTNAGTFIGYYQNGTVIQQILDFSRDQLNEVCRLGRISHFDRTQIDKVYNFPLTVETDLDFASWVIQQGVIKVKGCEIESGSNSLGTKRLNCETLRIGAGGSRDRINFPVVAEEDNFDMLWAHGNGAGTTIIEGSYNYIDVNNYELTNGTLQEISENKYSNIWIYFFPNNVSDTTFMIRDNSEYDDLFSAIEGIEESPTINDDIQGGIYLAVISFRKGISDLSTAIDDDVARISQVDSLGKVIKHQSGLVSLKNTLHTGLLSGGLLTINSGDPTLINISLGEAIIVDYSDIGDVKKDRLVWDDLTYAPNLAGVRSKWIGVQKHATTGQAEFVSAVAFTALEKRTIAVIGRVWGNGTTTITGKGQYSTPAFGYDKTVEDFISVFGSMNLQGNVFEATNGDLRIDKSSGKSFRFGAAFATEPLSPNIHIDSEIINLSSYKYHLQNSTTTISESEIDSEYYDLNGVKTIIPVGKYHIQRIYYFPVSERVHVTYGQAYYNSMGEALIGINTETVNLNDDILDGSILRSYLIMRESETDLSDTTYVKFISANNIGGGGSGAGISDHGSMSGLLDDDHPQYLLADGSRNVTNNFTVEKDIIAQNIYANLSFNYLQDVPNGISDGDNDTLGDLNCSDLQVIRYNATLGDWICIDALSFTDTVLNESEVDAYVANNGYLTEINYSNTVTVAKSGGDFTSIQSAIDSITNANSTSPYAILIYSGTYTEQITMKSNVNLLGMGAWARQVMIMNTQHPVVNWTTSARSEIRNVMIGSTPTTDQTECAIVASGGQKSLFDTVISVQSTDSNACALSINNVLPFISDRIGLYYTQNGETIGQQQQTIIPVYGTSYYIFSSWFTDINLYTQDDNLSFLKDMPGSIRKHIITTSTLDIKMQNTSYSGLARIYCDEATMTIPGKENSWQSNTLNLVGAGTNSTGVAMCLKNSNSIINTRGNHIDVHGFGTNYGPAIGSNSAMHSYFDEITAADGFNDLGGTYDYVNSPSSGDFQISGAFLNQYEQVITVESRGGDFQTIQAAIDSIIDATEDKTYTIKVMPGYYTENILLKDWVDLEGTGGWQSIINGTITWNNTANTPDGWSNLILMAVEYTVTSPGETILNIDEGLHDFDRCYFYTEGDSLAWHLVDIDAGETTFYNTEFEYYQTGNASSSEHNIITVGGTGTLKLLYDEFKVDIEDSNRDVNIIYSGASEGGLDHQASLSEIILRSSSYSGTVTFLNIQGNTNDNRFVGNNINIIGNNSGTAKMYNLNSGSAEIRSASNIITIQDFSNNYFANIGSNDKLYSHFDDVLAINGTIGSPADYEYVSSEKDGEFTVTEKINVGKGVNEDMTLLEILVGEIINPKLKYFSNWFGRTALVWDDTNNPSTFGVYSENENAGTIIRSGNESLNQYLMLYGGLEGWIFERLGSSNGDLYFSPDGAESNAPIHLEHGPPYRTYLNNGVGVNDIDTIIDLNSNDSQLVTALGIKNYVDTNLISYTHLSNFTDDLGNRGFSHLSNFTNDISSLWDTNVSDDFNGSWNALTDIPIGFSDNIDNNTQLSESEVDSFVSNNGYLTSSNEDVWDTVKYSVSTGLIQGGTLEINSSDNTKLDISSGSSLYVDHSDINNITVETLNFSSTTLAGGLNGKTSRWVGVQRISEGVGQILIQDIFTQAQKRTITVLGRIWGNGSSTINGRGQYSTTAYDTSKTLEDLLDTLSSLNKDGNVYYNQNPNLTLSKTAGNSFRYSALYSSDADSSSSSNDAEQLEIGLYFYHAQNRTYLDFLSLVDPDNYDNAGIVTSVPSGNYTIQRMYFFPGSGITLMTYGQALYDSMNDAELNVNLEEVVIEEGLVGGGILRGWLIVKSSTTDLSNLSNAKIVTSTGFSGSSAGGSAESDPIFSTSAANGISSADITNWDNAFSWNDHALSGYLTSSDLDWSNLTSIPAGFSDNVDNNTQLSEVEVDAFVADNNYAVENTSVNFNNITIAGGECYGGAEGGALCFNSTDTWII